MPQPFVEQLSCKPIVNLQATLSKIIKDSNLVSASEQQEDEKVVGVMKTLNKMQSQLSAASTGVRKVTMMMPEIKEDIVRAVGGMMSEEVAGLLNVFASNSESIEDHFSKLRDKIEESEHKVISAIREESAKAEKAVMQMMQLKDEMAAKDLRLK